MSELENIEDLLKANARQQQPWTQPEIFDLNDEVSRKSLEEKLHENDLQVVDSMQEQGATSGKWALYPWSNVLAHFPDKESYRMLRTSRNRELITVEEQKKLYAGSIAVMGLSVGSNVVERLVTSGIGGKLIIGDPDTLEVSNLNRINARYEDVGSRKIDIAARKISELDPYIEQVHLADGLTADNIEQLKEHGPHIIVDEIDNLAMKAAIRLFAYREGIPVVMATDVDDAAPLDVERYDLGTATPFNGRLTEDQVLRLSKNELTADELNAIRIGMVGMENVTPRLMESVAKIAQGELGGLPQLATTAAVGGSYVALASRQILLERDLPSGRYMTSRDIVTATPAK